MRAQIITLLYFLKCTVSVKVMGVFVVHAIWKLPFIRDLVKCLGNEYGCAVFVFNACT
jgi:hypothetical protein